MNDQSMTIQPQTAITDGGSPFSSITAFENAQRMAKALSAMDFVPQQYRSNPANCLLALEVAHRTGGSFLAVMQNLVIVHGKPSWEAKYIIGALNTCGRFEPLDFEQENAPAGSAPANWKDLPREWRCRAMAMDRRANVLRYGPWVSIEMAFAEGWIDKNGSKWKTMPELMLMYRAASFFGKLFAPEIMLGMQTSDELRDIVTVDAGTGEVVSVDSRRPRPTSRTDQVKELLSKVQDAPGESVEFEVIPDREPGADDE